MTQGANVDAKDESDVTALHYAALRGDHENVRFLLSCGANVNERHYRLGTPIFVAALRRHTEVVEALLQHKANLSVSFQGLGSALHCACFGGAASIVESILKTGQRGDLERVQVVYPGALAVIADTTLAPSRDDILVWESRWQSSPRIKCSPVLLAAERSHFDLLHLCHTRFRYAYCSAHLWELNDKDDKRIVRFKKVIRNLPSSSYNSAKFSQVCMWPPHGAEESRTSTDRSNTSTSSAWSFLGCPPPAQTAVAFTSTLLMWAAAGLNLRLIEHLLEGGGQVLRQDTIGRSALHYAALPLDHATFEDVGECFQRLLHGRSLSVTTADTLLRLTVSAEHPALDPRTLHKWGSDIHSRCVGAILNHITSALSRCLLSRKALLELVSKTLCPSDSVELLCNNASQPDEDSECALQMENNFLDTALARALRCSAAEAVIAVLLEHGADPNLEPQDMKRVHTVSPLMTAIRADAPKAIVAILLRYGAEPNMVRGGLLTPYELAEKKGRQDLIALFTCSGYALEWTVLIAEDTAKAAKHESVTCEMKAISDGIDCRGIKRVAHVTSDSPRRSRFPGFPAISIPRFLRDGK